MKIVIGSLMAVALLLQTPTYQRGDVVSVKSENSCIARVIAIPGDRVRIDDSGVYVNGIAVTWISRELLSAIAKPWEPEVIPAGHYFVAGEERTELVGKVSVSRYWALTGANNLSAVPR